MFESLNPQQQLAVTQTDGPTLILAGAGSGKTRVLLEKILHFVAAKLYPPEMLLAITFTQQAANELKQRLLREGKKRDLSVKEVTVGTFHSYALSLLRRYRKNLGSQARLLLCSEADKLEIIQTLLGQEAGQRSNPDLYDQIASQISFWKNHEIDPAAASRAISKNQAVVAKVYCRYEEHLKKFGWVDFEDLLKLTLEQFQLNPECLREEQARYRYLFIDEFQDTNPIQWRIARALIGTRGFTIVGDDDQAIYGWRGADPKILNEVIQAYPQLRVIKLEKSYRCAQPIVKVANAVIQHNPHMFEKELYSDRAGEKIQMVALPNGEAEAEWIAQQIECDRLTCPKKQVAILYRSHHHARGLKEALQEKKIEARIIGEEALLEKPEARLMADYCRVINDPTADASLLRIVNTPKRGIGLTTLYKAGEWSEKHKKSYWETLTSVGFLAQIKANERGAVESFTACILEQQKKMWNLERTPSAEWGRYLHDLIQTFDLRTHLATGVSEKFFFVRCKRLHKICTLLLTQLKYSQSLRLPGGDFASALNKLDGPYSDRDEKNTLRGSPVYLMTLHASKGLEFDAVYLCGLEQGILPHHSAINSMQIQEERRLFYVGLTRAKSELTLTYAYSRTRFDRALVKMPSPFLKEIPDQEVKRLHISPEALHRARAGVAQKYLSQLRAALEKNAPQQ